MSKRVGVFENHPVNISDLGEQQLFRQVNVVGLEPLLNNCPSLKLPEGTTLIEPGQINQLLYLVLVGDLYVYDGDATGEPLAVIQKGECIGLMSLMDQQPCHVRVVAKHASRVLVIDEDQFFALANSSNAVARNALSMVMQYLRGKKAVVPERGRVQKRMEQNSNVDAVTGMYNERWLETVLERQMMRAATDRKSLSVLAVGIEGFAAFKEEFGGEVADFALAHVAKLIAENVRPTDMVARHGADHFLIALPDTDMTGADTAERRVRSAVEQTAIEIPNACRLPPLKLITGKVQMKAFVAARKLVDEAAETLSSKPVLAIAS